MKITEKVPYVLLLNSYGCPPTVIYNSMLSCICLVYVIIIHVFTYVVSLTTNILNSATMLDFSVDDNVSVTSVSASATNA